MRSPSITKCRDCKIWYQKFHVCIDLTTPEPKHVYNIKIPHRALREMTPELRTSFEQANRERYRKRREQNIKKDTAIIDRYNQGDIGMIALAKTFKVSRTYIITLFRDARESGIEVLKREPGLNIRHARKA